MMARALDFDATGGMVKLGKKRRRPEPWYNSSMVDAPVQRYVPRKPTPKPKKGK